MCGCKFHSILRERSKRPLAAAPPATRILVIGAAVASRFYFSSYLVLKVTAGSTPHSAPHLAPDLTSDLNPHFNIHLGRHWALHLALHLSPHLAPHLIAHLPYHLLSRFIFHVLCS